MVKRGELYRVSKPTKSDPKNFRVFVIVGRQEVIESIYSTVICAPIYSIVWKLKPKLKSALMKV